MSKKSSKEKHKKSKKEDNIEMETPVKKRRVRKKIAEPADVFAPDHSTESDAASEDDRSVKMLGRAIAIAVAVAVGVGACSVISALMKHKGIQ